MDILKNLNPVQKEAVLYDKGPLLILAGAGTGKTRALTYKMAYLIKEKKYPSSSVLGVTFTNKAANEMKHRIWRLLGKKDLYWLSTFHSACVKILRKTANFIGVNPHFIIYDGDDSLSVIKEITKDLHLDKNKISPSITSSLISQAKNKNISAENFCRTASDYITEIAGKIYLSYEKKLSENNALDFDDLIIKTVKLFKENPAVLKTYQEKFKYILVDEYQDVNYAQYLLVKYLASAHKKLCVVGDDDQSIYGFRGADISIILQFEKDFPESKIIKLEQNYRSTENILNAANSLVINNVTRKEKSLWTSKEQGDLITNFVASDERNEARWVVDKIKTHLKENKYKLGDFVILYRTNAQSRIFEEVLLQEGIPYDIVGALRFYARREIKDIIAYLRVILNPQDGVSLQRIINTPPRGIGRETLSKILQYQMQNEISFYEALNKIDKINDINDRLKLKIKDFLKMINSFQNSFKKHTLTQLVKSVIQKTGYREYLASEDTISELNRLENLDELLSVTLEFEKRTQNSDLELFLSEMALISEVDTYKHTTGAVTLITLHLAKGLEFRVVFLVGLEEGMLPHSRSVFESAQLEEERRLCYVGVTRAKEKLYLTRAKQRTIYGSTSESTSSRFLEEISPELIYLEESTFYEAPLVILDSLKTEQLPPFQIGEKCSHHIWGEGKIMFVEGQAVTVLFLQGEKKTILADFLSPAVT